MTRHNANSPRAPGGNQDTRTPPDLLQAIERRFGRLDWDLASTEEHKVAPRCITPEMDSLSKTTAWPDYGTLFLNPPFADLEPWVRKCADWVTEPPRSASSVLLLLVPASVDAVWWNDHVRKVARVLALAPRVTFVGHERGYPKPMVLCVYEARWPKQSEAVELWRWK